MVMSSSFFCLAAAFLALVSASSAASTELRTRSRFVAENGEPFNENCTALVGLGVDSTDSKEMNQTWMSCLTPEGMIHDIEGACMEWVEEKIRRAQVISNHATVDTDGATLDSTTDRVTMSTFPPTIIPGTFSPPELKNRLNGNKTILAVRVVTLDSEPLISEARMKATLFGPTNISLSEHMLACSQNNLNLLPKQLLKSGRRLGDTQRDLGLTQRDACLSGGLGTRQASNSKNYPPGESDCPASSFVCYGVKYASTINGTEFAMAADVSPTLNGVVTLSCYAKKDGNNKVDIVVTTKVVKTGYQFEIRGDTYFMSQVKIKGVDGVESKFKFTYENRNKTYAGGIIKSTGWRTPKHADGSYADLTSIRVCVMRRTTCCAPLSQSVEAIGNNGILTVHVPHYNHEGDSIIRNAVTAELLNYFSAGHPEDIADFMMYCLPQNVTPRVGYGFAYSWLSVYSDPYCGRLAVQMREFGHNIGLGPSRNWGTFYGDYTGMMGDNNFRYARKCYNSAKMYQTGWYANNTIVLHKDSKAEKIDLHGLVKPLEPGQETIPKLIKLDSNSKNMVDLYMICNWDGEANSQTYGPYRNKVVIARTGYNAEMFAFSILMDSLDEGETFVQQRYYDGLCDLNVKVGNIDSDAGICEVTVTGCVDGAPTIAPTIGSPTIKPTDRPTHPPPPPCYAQGDLCATEDDCCDNNTGQCTEVAENDNLNVMIVCTAAGAIPEVSVAVSGPEGSGTCDDNGECGPGENCFSCPNDCNALLSGDPINRYCCENSKIPRAAYSIKATDARCQC